MQTVKTRASHKNTFRLAAFLRDSLASPGPVATGEERARIERVGKSMDRIPWRMTNGSSTALWSRLVCLWLATVAVATSSAVEPTNASDEPSLNGDPATLAADDASGSAGFSLPSYLLDESESTDAAAKASPTLLPAVLPHPAGAEPLLASPSETGRLRPSSVSNALATSLPGQNESAVQRIPTHLSHLHAPLRVVRYEVPLDDLETHAAFTVRGIEGRLLEVTDKAPLRDGSLGDRLRAFWDPMATREKAKKVRVVRYEVPADDIAFHAELTTLQGELLEPGMLRLPEVRFFQPKARVFLDLKQDNDDDFDLFDDGAILASLDIIELYFPMPLFSERFAEAAGRTDRLSSLGWRVGGTIGLGITTALNNGAASGSAPVSAVSTGIRYDFPLGRPSRELIESGDPRMDQRTRVGMEFGIQAGISTRESLRDATDVGLYLGILVNTPWGV